MIFFDEFPSVCLPGPALDRRVPGWRRRGDGGETSHRRIRAGDFESWQRGWMWLADHVRERADSTLSTAGHLSTRRVLRAANYDRCRRVLPRPRPPRQAADLGSNDGMLRQSRRAFWDPPFEVLDLPYLEGVTLPAYLVRPGTADRPRPTVLYLNGADGTKEESWDLAGRKLRRPRGSTSWRSTGPAKANHYASGICIRDPTDEAVVGPAVEALAARDDVLPDRIALVGISMGGYYAARAGALRGPDSPRSPCTGRATASRTICTTTIQASDHSFSGSPGCSTTRRRRSITPPSTCRSPRPGRRANVHLPRFRGSPRTAVAARRRMTNSPGARACPGASGPPRRPDRSTPTSTTPTRGLSRVCDWVVEHLT